MTGTYEDLLRVVERHAGHTFRAAFSYDSDGWETLYVREDLATEELRAVVPDLYERVQSQEPLVPRDVYQRLGETEATVELHEGGVLLHLWEGPSQGVVVTLDTEAARNLAEFVDRCTAVLSEE